MALHKLVRKNYGGKSPVSIKYQNLHSFKEGMILLCHCILETRRMSYLPGSAFFTIPLNKYLLLWKNLCIFTINQLLISDMTGWQNSVVKIFS